MKAVVIRMPSFPTSPPPRDFNWSSNGIFTRAIYSALPSDAGGTAFFTTPASATIVSTYGIICDEL